MGLRERKKRPQVGQTMANVFLGSPEEFRGRVFLGSPEERQGLGSPEEFGGRYYLGSPEELPPLLTFGSTGRWVVYLQGKLGVPVTGVYDARTMGAVRQVQAMAGLAQTGMTDIATWAAVARLPQGYGFGQLAAPYGSYGPYGGGYGPSFYNYSYYPFWFRNPPRGASSSGSSSGGGGRVTGGQ